MRVDQLVARRRRLREETPPEYQYLLEDLFETISQALLNAVDPSLSGTASGVLNTSRQLGGALAVAVFGALLSSTESFAAGLLLSMVVAAALSLAAAVVTARSLGPTDR